jgi:hypothetical protein
MPDTPWVGLAALIAMFVIPFLPNWLFEGPRTVKHWPRRHICGDCHQPWSDRHMCSPTGIETCPPLHGELGRLEPATDLERWPLTVNALLQSHRDDQMG